MGGRLDRYVAKTMLGAYGACLLFLVLLSVLMDLLFYLGAYMDAAQEHDVGVVTLMAKLAYYYVLMAPLIFVTVSPFISVIAGMFAVSRLMSANEVAPMLFTGRSITRVLRPVLFTAVVSALTTAACWEFVIPSLVEQVTRLRTVLNGKEPDLAIERLALGPDDQHRFLFCAKYYKDLMQMEGVTMVQRGLGGADTVLVQAAAADWNPEAADWDLQAGERRSGDLAVRQDRLGMSEVTPDLLWRTSKGGREVAQLSYTDLLDLQALRPARRDYVLAFHSHLTFPLANIVLLLLALPFAVHFERGGRAGRVLFAVMVCGLYLVTDLACQNLGQYTLHPILAAWLPTILYGSVGVVFFTGIRT